MTPNQTFLHFVALYAPLFLAHQDAMEEAGYGPRRSDTSKAGYRRSPKPKTALSAICAAHTYRRTSASEETEAMAFLSEYFKVKIPWPDPPEMHGTPDL